MTMTDRELLERAARAAGLGEVWYLEGSATPYIGPRYEPGKKIGYSVWNPLTDDGDALRLAVELDLLWDRDVHYTKFLDLSDKALLSATRRAIVRAAAAMAKED